MSNDIPAFEGLFQNVIGRMHTAYLTVDENGLVNWLGIDQPHGELIKVNGNKNLLVVKIPGHQYWRARGEQGYAAAEYQVFWALEGTPAKRIKCAFLGSFPVRSKVSQMTAMNLIEHLDHAP